ncbi:GABA/polyamine transporter [Ascosphaera pollenicola]|nr:GABA/polyamine transporter [Ascosphaera pollenicola]
MIVITSSNCIVGGKLTPATIVIDKKTGKVTSVDLSVLPKENFTQTDNYRDYSPYVVMPGLVDAHVHLNEPGRTEWEGFYTGTQAAAFGGVTTVIDMPLNAIPPTTTVAGFHEKLKAAKNQCWVDVGFWGGLVPGNTGELKALVKEGVRGFKGFLIHSGVDEFPAVTASDIRDAMSELAHEKTTLMFHAEMMPQDPPTEDPSAPIDAYSTFLDSRPASFETCAVEEILSQAHVAPELPLHVVHLSAKEVIPLLRAARQRGVKITAETCFHYLSLAAEQIPHGDTRHKCCPPIRSQLNQDALWEEVYRYDQDDGVIKTIVSDHSPCTPDLKLLPTSIPGSCCGQSSTEDTSEVGSFMKAWGGISSVGLGLPILWTEMSKRIQAKGGESQEQEALEMLHRLCSANTAAQVGLSDRKGDLAVGFDADICVFDPSAEWTVSKNKLLFRNKCSPYEGKQMRGMVLETWIRGKRIFERSRAEEGNHGLEGMIGNPEGRLLLEPRRA